AVGGWFILSLLKATERPFRNPTNARWWYFWTEPKPICRPSMNDLPTALVGFSGRNCPWGNDSPIAGGISSPLWETPVRLALKRGSNDGITVADETTGSKHLANKRRSVMPEKKEVTIKLTDEQRSQIKGTTGKDIGELKFEAVEDRANPSLKFESVEDRANPLSIVGDEKRANPLVGVTMEERSNPLVGVTMEERSNPLVGVTMEERSNPLVAVTM